MFEYASDEGICNNTWSKVKINTKNFCKTVKKDNKSQIYFSDEKQKIITLAMQLYKDNPKNNLIMLFVYVDQKLMIISIMKKKINLNMWVKKL